MPFLAHFGLKERPFALTPNSGLYFPAESHQEVLTSLMYAIERGEGVVKVSGEVGTGKTLLCRILTAELIKTKAVAYIINPQDDPEWIVGAVCREFGLDPESTDDRLFLLNSYLLQQFAAGRRVVLVIDEAQALGVAGLETMRRLSNLETEQTKLMQTVLFGQPELDELLDTQELRQLNQRIVFSFSLPALSAKETAAYINHRIERSSAYGKDAKPLFDARAVKAIARASQGIPRITNIIADKSLLAAFTKQDHRVTAAHVNDAIKDSRRIIEQLPDFNEGGWGRRILDALNRWVGDGGSRPPSSPAAKSARAALRVYPEISVADAAEEWLRVCEDRRLKPATLEMRRGHVQRITKSSFGGAQAAALTVEGIEEFLRSFAPGEEPQVLASLKSILTETVRRGHIKANPAKDMKLASAKPAPKPLYAPRPEEIRLLLPAAGDALAVRMTAALLTGLRANEMRALSWDNVDLDDGLIHVRRLAVGGGELVRVRPRAARRSLPMAPVLVAFLSEWRKACPEAGLNLVFPDKQGRVIGAGLMQGGEFARLQKKLGITKANGKAKYRFDDLRHAAAMLLIDQGWAPRKLRDHLGEASIAATSRRYEAAFSRAADDRTALGLIAERLLRGISEP